MNHIVRASRATVAAIALIFLIHCATAQTAQQNAFNGLKTIRVGVEGALTVFNAGYQAGIYTEAQRTQLQTLYVKYLAADKIAAEALGASLQTDPATIVGKVTVVAADVIRFVQLLQGTP